MVQITNHQCLSDDQLIELLHQGEASDFIQEIDGHLSQCDTCRMRLDQLTDSEVLTQWKTLQSTTREEELLFLEPAERSGDLGSLGKYAIEKELGRGGSGIVFRAFDQELKRKVAVKVLAFDTHHWADQRFDREANAAARVNGDHVVRLYETGKTKDNRPFLVMQLVEGESLKELLERGVPEPKRTAELIRTAAKGLHEIHTAGTIHRDMKPANILIDQKGYRARLTDFGLARSTDDKTLTQRNILCGTPEYMSPEQASSSGKLTAKSDVYSLGVTLYECLVGTPPYRGQPMQILEMHRNGAPVLPSRLNPAVPKDLENICLKAMAAEPGQRYDSAKALAADLDRFLQGRPVLAREVTQWQRLRMWCRRSPAMAAMTGAAAALLLLVTVGSIVFSWRMSSANGLILEEQKRVELAQQKAAEDRSAAIESLDRLVDSLYDDLSKNAATIKTREKIVNAVMMGLNSLIEISDDQEADRTSLKAHSRIADLYSLQGKRSEAEIAFGKSIELARSLVASAPDDLTAQRELAKTLDQLALHHVRNLEFQPMIELKSEVTKILSSILEQNPDDLQALRQLVTSRSRDLDYLWQNSTPQEALEKTKSAIADLEKLLKLEDNNAQNYIIANGLHSRLGRSYLEAGKLEQADEEFELARQRIDIAARMEGGNSEVELHSAVTERMRGVLLNSLGRQQESLAAFERASIKFQTLAAADSQNALTFQNLANNLLLSVLPHLALGNFESAAQLNQQAILIYQRLLNETDQKIMYRSLLIQAHAERTSLCVRMTRWEEAIANANQTIRYIDGDAQNPKLTSPQFDGTRLSVIADAKAAARMLGQMEPLQNSTEILGTLFLIGLVEAKENTTQALSKDAVNRIVAIDAKLEVQTFDELVDQVYEVSKKATINPITLDFNLARLWSLRAQRLAQSSNADVSEAGDDQKVELSRCQHLAMKHLSIFTHTYPTVAYEIFKEPDFNWLRNTRDFQTSLSTGKSGTTD